MLKIYTNFFFSIVLLLKKYYYYYYYYYYYKHKRFVFFMPEALSSFDSLLLSKHSVMQTKFLSHPTLSAISALTSRELRRFRSLYVSRTRTPFAVSSMDANTSTFNFSFYGNAEAISPAQRRRFREAKTTNKLHSKRKVSIFPTKRGARLYSLTSLSFFNSLLHGTLLCATVSILSDKKINRNLPVVNLFHRNRFQNKFGILESFESSFHFRPNLVTFKPGSTSRFRKNEGPVLSRKYDAWKNYQFPQTNKVVSHVTLEQLPAIHLSPFDSLFLFTDVVSSVSTDVIFAIQVSQELIKSKRNI